MKATTVGIDLAKTTFQVCALNRAGKVISNHPVNRGALIETVPQLHPTRSAMESCAGRIIGSERSRTSAMRSSWCRHSTSSRSFVAARASVSSPADETGRK